MEFGKKEMISVISIISLIIIGILLVILPSNDVAIPVFGAIYKGIIIFYFGKRTGEEIVKLSKEKDGVDVAGSYKRPFMDKNFLIRTIIGAICLIFLLPAYLIPSENTAVFLENVIIVFEAFFISAGAQMIMKRNI